MTLYDKVYNYDYKSLFNKKGYSFFIKGAYNLNIIGVRATNKLVSNKFEDYLVVIYYTPTGIEKRYVFSITTKPGKYYMNNPLNYKGTSVMVPNQYKGAYKIGLHKNKYKALCQVKPIKVYRDGNKDDIYDLAPGTIEEGLYGCNIHKAGTNSSEINKWSAGCQVFKSQVDFNTFMYLCKKQVENGLGNSFTYTLLNEEDLT